MGTLAISVPIDRAATTLLDAAKVGWTAPELLNYANAAMRSIVQLKGDAYTKIGTITLVAGVDQVLPSDGLALINLYRNVASGKGVQQMGYDVMLATDMDFATRTRKVDVAEWISDQRQPQRFMVNPPNTGAGALTGVYSATPPVLTSASDLIPLPDSYEPAIYNGILHFAYAKNSREQDLQKSTAALQAMIAMVTGRTATVKQLAPDLKKAEQDQS